MGGGKKLGDVDIEEAARVIATNLDESMMESIILPMFVEARVFSVTNKKFLKSSTEIDQCFTVDTLFDLYLLIFEIARFQFGPFFSSLSSRFGNAVTGGTTA